MCHQTPARPPCQVGDICLLQRTAHFEMTSLLLDGIERRSLWGWISHYDALAATSLRESFGACEGALDCRRRVFLPRLLVPQGRAPFL